MVIIIQRILQGLPILKTAAADEAQELTLHFNSIFTEPVQFFIVGQISDFGFLFSFSLIQVGEGNPLVPGTGNPQGNLPELPIGDTLQDRSPSQGNGL